MLVKWNEKSDLIVNILESEFSRLRRGISNIADRLFFHFNRRRFEHFLRLERKRGVLGFRFLLATIHAERRTRLNDRLDFNLEGERLLSSF